MRSSVEETINKAQAYAIQHQFAEGYWRGSDLSNNTMEAEYILVNYFLGVNNPTQTKKLVKRLLDCQHDDGTWGIYYGSSGELSTTIECYFALKLAGINTDLPNMQNARNFILAHGGVEKSRNFTKFWLALFGQWPWSHVPILPPEMMYLPNWFVINIYEFSSWARSGIVPLMIVLTQRPVCKIPENANIKELFITSAEHPVVQSLQTYPFFSMKNFFSIIDKCLRLYEKCPWKPGRKRAIKKALDWIVERQQEDGTWGGTQVGWVYPLLALGTLKYDEHHPYVKRCLEGVIKNYSYENDGALQIEATNSPIWDTCLMLTALFDSGMPATTPAITHSIQFLLRNLITTPGDWQVKNPNTESAGWAFEFANSYYPDIDDIAEVIIALSRYLHLIQNEDENVKNAIQKSTQWMLSMQSKNGGWAAFDKDNTQKILTQLPFFDFGEILDPPSVDVTAHVLEALGELDYSLDHPQIKSALDFIFREQEKDGSWFGRWGVNYIYGTSSVLVALYSLHFDITDTKLKLACEWLISKQNADGGWGESCASYVSLEDGGVGPSTASQTAWALMGLIVSGFREHASVTKGIKYLCETITAEGIWDEPFYTGCGFGGYLTGTRPTKDMVKHLSKDLPTGFMLRYDLYRHYWPLRALGMYQNSFLR